MRVIIFVVLLMQPLISSNAFAEHQYNIPRWYVSLARTSGGDDVAKLDILSEDTSSTEIIETENLSAGDGFQLNIGNAFRVAKTPLSVRLSVGWHSDKLTATKGKTAFSRIPVEMLGFFAYGNHRVGIGPTVHLRTELDIEDAAGPIVDFEAASGFVAEYGYALGGLGYLSTYWIGLRAVSIEYEVDKVDGVNSVEPTQRFDGTHSALFVAVAW